MPIQGIVPSQYSECFRLGVCPLSSWATLLNGVHVHPGGGCVSGIPTDRANRPGITPVVASLPPVRPVPISETSPAIAQPLEVRADGGFELRRFGELGFEFGDEAGHLGFEGFAVVLYVFGADVAAGG